MRWYYFEIIECSSIDYDGAIEHRGMTEASTPETVKNRILQLFRAPKIEKIIIYRRDGKGRRSYHYNGIGQEINFRGEPK